jgi:hypothetical protein
MVPDLNSPPWWFAAAFVAVLAGLMIWFPVYYWRKDRARRSGQRHDRT